MSTADEIIREVWPEHADCLASYGQAQTYDDDGVVCSCGYVLGWPPDANEDTNTAVAGDAPADVQADQFDRDMTHPDLAETANEDPDGRLIDQQGPVPHGMDEPPWDADGPTKLDTTGGARPDAGLARVPSSAVVPEDPIAARLAAIDPMVPYTPTDIELQLVDIERRLESGQLFQRVWEQRLYETANAYEVAWATAMNECDASSADKRKAAVFLKTQDAWQAKAEAEYMAKAVRDTMHNLRAMLTGFQSIAKSVAASMSVAGMDMNRERGSRS